jgi:hypothetical protein
MLNSVPGHLLSMPKIEIKNKINGDKTTFYIFKAFNAHVLRQNFYINKFNQYQGSTL